MSELTDGQRQRREVNSYNLFYSAVTARASPSLAAHGVRVPVMFPLIKDRPRDVEAEPDILLYDGETCVLVEIKSGNNIDDRDIKQMGECANVTIEAAEGVLTDAKVREKTEYDGTVSSVEPVIIYQDLDESYIIQIQDKSDTFQEALADITENAVLMTQDYGGKLRVLEGEFNDDNDLQSLLKRGVDLPVNPPDEVMLTEGMEQEILAMAIGDIWGEQVVDHDDSVEVTRTEIRDFFAPRHNVSPGDLKRVFEFLIDIDACEQIENQRYEFAREHMSAILRIEEMVMEQTVNEYLREEDQATIDAFSGEDE